MGEQEPGCPATQRVSTRVAHRVGSHKFMLRHLDPQCLHTPWQTCILFESSPHAGAATSAEMETLLLGRMKLIACDAKGRILQAVLAGPKGSVLLVVVEGGCSICRLCRLWQGLPPMLASSVTSRIVFLHGIKPVHQLDDPPVQYCIVLE